MSEYRQATPTRVDVRGLQCPLPLLRARQALGRVASGECIEVLASDSSSVKDFQAFIALTAHQLRGFQQCNGEYRFLIEKH